MEEPIKTETTSEEVQTESDDETIIIVDETSWESFIRTIPSDELRELILTWPRRS
jgi:hypothetical protein